MRHAAAIARCRSRHALARDPRLVVATAAALLWGLAAATTAARAQGPTRGAGKQGQGEVTRVTRTPENRRLIQQRINEMREALERGGSVRTNVRVKVKLANGNKIQGVVRNGRFIERVSGLDFVPTEMAAPGAGLRVWYYDNTTSYIFLRYADITSYKIGARLTNVEVQAIEDRIRSEREESERLRRAAREKLMLDRGENGDESGGKSGDESDQLSREQVQLLTLLDQFPPADGWGPDRLREIQTRKITVGAYPDELSKRFVDSFEDWQRAVELRKKLDAKKAEAAKSKQKKAANEDPAGGSASGTGADKDHG